MLSLSKLAELAKDKTSTGRKSLVAAVTDLFLSADDDHVEEVSLIFGDIVMHVLGQLEHETRLALAKRVGRHRSAPHKLMKELAQDTIEIARPVLEDSPVLKMSDLVDVAATQSMDHLSAIAGRSNLDEAVTEVLVDRGDSSVLTKVTANPGAHFADTTYLRLVDKAKADPDIQSALVQRTDMPEEAARMLVPFLSKELTERIKELNVDGALVQVMAERAAAEVAARAQRAQQTRDQINQLIKDVAAGKTKIDDAVSYFAKSDRAAELGILLAKVSNLPAAGVSRLVYTESDKALSIICKANGVTQSAYKHILTMRAKHLRMGGLELNAALQRYSALTDSSAQKSLGAIRASIEQHMPKREDETKKDGKKPVPFAVHR
ncbi:hypothetical protein GCM10011316_05080 [Roseibium aquae]|uniref:DUF2336 domain-containing protein n=1 Tax=Roseibium aquae TaxID=1323746 RepID=A0A916WWG9_9HYPH|nr:DUF2336 domain-containing protein [Roseibium aquae]GGB35918.1 hypothetical protein GCM10011316_05080 [Roseibium aquae]